MASAYKRHTYILIRSLQEALSRIDQFDVWEEPSFIVSPQAENLANQLLTDAHQLLDKSLDYDPQKAYRDQKIDLIVFNKVTNSISSYVIKRGNGLYDSGTKKALLRDLLTSQLLLKSYGQKKRLPISKATSHIIFYYGKRSIPSPFSLVKDELDEHFNAKIVEEVEQINEYFKKSLTDMTSSYNI